MGEIQGNGPTAADYVYAAADLAELRRKSDELKAMAEVDSLRLAMRELRRRIDEALATSGQSTGASPDFPMRHCYRCGGEVGRMPPADGHLCAGCKRRHD